MPRPIPGSYDPTRRAGRGCMHFVRIRASKKILQGIGHAHASPGLRREMSRVLSESRPDALADSNARATTGCRAQV